MILFLLSGLCNAQNTGEPIAVKASTPCWFQASPDEDIAFVINSDTQVKATGVNKYYVIKRGSLYRRVLFNQFVYGQKKYWLCQDMRAVQDVNGAVRAATLPSQALFPEYLFLGSIFALLLLVIGWLNLYRDEFKADIWKRYKPLWMLLFLLLIHYLWIGYFIFYTADWGHLPLDETADFIDARLLLAGDFTTRLDRTLGMALFYAPFVWFSGAGDIYDVAPIISWIMTLVIAPFGLACGFLMVRKVSKSDWLAFSAILLFLLIPKIYLPEERNVCSIFGPFFIYPESYIFNCYYQIISGFNSMSDTVAAALMFAVLLSAVKLRTGAFRYLFVSGLFAVACHIRMNNIFFAPLIAYIFWHSDPELLHDYRYGLKMTAYSLGIFLLVYSPQLLLNHYQNGGFLTYPYVFYKDTSGQGFEVSKLSAVTTYLMKIHYFYYGGFVAACFVIRDSYKRNFLILWVVPMTIFFCGFWLGQPFRFLLSILPGTIAAMVIAADELRTTMKNPKQLWLLGILLFILVFPALPVYGLKQAVYNYYPIAEIKGYIVPFACLTVIGWYWFRREWRCLAAAAIYGAVFVSSSPWIIFGAFIALLLWSVSSWVSEIIASKRANIK